jgi:hypothetical protein
MIFIYKLLLAKYNPITINELTGRPISGVSGPEYRNFVWPIFGLNDRYHGPFTHPNQLGIYCAFFATLMASSRKLLFRISALGFVILTFCAASRTSIIVSTVGVTLLWSKLVWTISLKQRIRFLSYFTVAALGLIFIVGSSNSSGRNSKFKDSFLNYPINLFYGTSTFYVENTFLTNLFSLGLVAFLLVCFLQLRPLFTLWKIDIPQARLGIPVSIQFFIASMGESVVYGSGINTGTLYMVILLTTINFHSLNPEMG